MNTQTLQVEVRQAGGKGPARQLRMQGKIPAVLYGPGIDTTKLTIAPKEFVKALTTDMGRNAIFELTIEGNSHLAMARDIQVHPVTRDPLHIDFYRVSVDREVTAPVPLRTRGRAAGVQKGGQLQVIFRELPVRCTPDKLPAFIEVDVTNLEMNEVIKVEDVQLPEGVRILLAADRRIINVSETRKAVATDTAEGAEGGAAAAG